MDLDFIENPEWRINLVLKKMIGKINHWIYNGNLGFGNIKKEAVIKSKEFIGNTNGFYYHFSIDNNYYILYFMIMTEWALEEKIKKCYIRLDKYNKKYINVEKTHSENLKIKNFTDEKLKQIINKLNV